MVKISRDHHECIGMLCLSPGNNCIDDITWNMITCVQQFNIWGAEVLFHSHISRITPSAANTPAPLLLVCLKSFVCLYCPKSMYRDAGVQDITWNMILPLPLSALQGHPSHLTGIWRFSWLRKSNVQNLFYLLYILSFSLAPHPWPILLNLYDMYLKSFHGHNLSFESSVYCYHM